METIRATSLLHHRTIFLEGWPILSSRTAGVKDTYLGARASLGADHESFKTPGTASHSAVMKRIEQIADDPNLTDKQKRATINDLRKQLGLSKGDMKKVYTKPLERAYAQKIEQLKASGIDTTQKAQLLEQLESKRKLYGSMYKSGGCVKKLFKGIGKGLAAIGKVAAGVATAIVNPFSLVPLIGKIPGVGKAFHDVSGAVSKATGFVENGLNKVTGWMDTGAGYVRKGIQFSKDVASIFGNFGV